MPRLDSEHFAVIRALEKDGWQVSDQQITLMLEGRHLWVDLEAIRASDRLFIFVEVKGFKSGSPATDLADALGQYLLYRYVIGEQFREEIPLYLAVPDTAYNGILSERLGRAMREKYDLRLIVVNLETEEIVQWIPKL